MRTKLLLAGLLAGVATSVVPMAPAAAYCEPEVIVIEGGGSGGGCRNSCVETGERYEALREKVTAVDLPSYWSLFACPM